MKRPILILLFLSSCDVLSAAEPIRVMASIRATKQPIFTDLSTEKVIEIDQLKAEIRRRSNEKWLIYIHGFSASAKGAVERADKIDDQRQFNILFLDWPSGFWLHSIWPGYILGKLGIAGCSGETFAETVRDLFWSSSVSSDVAELNFVAHSMGAEVTRKIVNAAPGGIHEVVLIAPCTYAVQFENELDQFRSKIGRLTVYGSTIDKILWAGHMGTLRDAPDTRSLGTLHRHRNRQDYDLINVTCLYHVLNPINLFYAHFPSNETFYEDVRGVLRHEAAESRPGLIWVHYEYLTPLGTERFPHDLWNMGKPNCAMAERKTMTISPRQPE